MSAVRQIRKLQGLPEVKTVGKIVLEKGIPIPPRQSHGTVSEALRVMEVGESFAHPCRISTGHLEKGLAGKSFAQRKQATGYRIWRTK